VRSQVESVDYKLAEQLGKKNQDEVVDEQREADNDSKQVANDYEIDNKEEVMA